MSQRVQIGALGKSYFKSAGNIALRDLLDADNGPEAPSGESGGRWGWYLVDLSVKLIHSTVPIAANLPPALSGERPNAVDFIARVYPNEQVAPLLHRAPSTPLGMYF